MRWIDVYGPPGVGKSSLCDPLWSPHAIDWQDQTIEQPEEWEDFLKLCMRFLDRVKEHPTYEACYRMTQRSVRKMSKVLQDPRTDIYVQTGLVQRGLGFGWRLQEMGKVEEVRAYFEAMPLSLGVVCLHADEKVLLERNKKREENPETSFENRSHMVPLMKRPMEIAFEVFNEKKVPIMSVDTGTVGIEQARRAVVEFRETLNKSHPALHDHSFRPDYKEATLQTYLV